MKIFEVIVTQGTNVEVDETRFTDEWMAEFRESFYDFYTMEDHIEHLASGFARGLWDNYSFIEGYGPAKEFGIKFTSFYTDAEIE